MEESKKASKNLLITIPLEIHKEIKMQAAKRITSMRMYVLRAVLRQLYMDRKFNQEGK